MGKQMKKVKILLIVLMIVVSSVSFSAPISACNRTGCKRPTIDRYDWRHFRCDAYYEKSHRCKERGYQRN